MVTTRKRAAKADQSGDDNKDPPKGDDNNKSGKRKRTEPASADKPGDEVDLDSQRVLSKARLEADPEEQENVISQQAEQVVCLCRHDVMKCIGILPSLPIINSGYCNSDESESDLEDYSHTVLPIVDRSSNKQHHADD